MKGFLRTHYEHFDLLSHRVPVQYGRYSKDTRKVRLLGAFGNLDEYGEVVNFYRVEPDQPGAGRFFEVRRIKDETGELWDTVAYLKLEDIAAEFPEVQHAILTGGKTVFGEIPESARMRAHVLLKRED